MKIGRNLLEISVKNTMFIVRRSSPVDGPTVHPNFWFGDLNLTKHLFAEMCGQYLSLSELSTASNGISPIDICEKPFPALQNTISWPYLLSRSAEFHKLFFSSKGDDNSFDYLCLKLNLVEYLVRYLRKTVLSAPKYHLFDNISGSARPILLIFELNLPISIIFQGKKSLWK